MKNIILVGLGGFMGSVLRYKIGEMVSGINTSRFPLGTFLVNIIGCFVIGLLAGMAQKYQILDDELRPLIFIGLLGGFTTFSTFGFETFALMKKGEILTTCLYVGLTVVIGVGLVWAGNKLGG